MVFFGSTSYVTATSISEPKIVNVSEWGCPLYSKMMSSTWYANLQAHRWFASLFSRTWYKGCALLVVLLLHLAGRAPADCPRSSLSEVLFHHDPDFGLVDDFTQTPSRDMLPVDYLGASGEEDIVRHIRFEMGLMTHPVALSEGPHQVSASILISVPSAISTVVVGIYSELCCTGSVAGAVDPECFLKPWISFTCSWISTTTVRVCRGVSRCS